MNIPCVFPGNMRQYGPENTKMVINRAPSRFKRWEVGVGGGGGGCGAVANDHSQAKD